MTKEKLILELVQQGRLGIDDALRLLDVQPEPTKFGPQPEPRRPYRPRRRTTKTQNVITTEQHFEIVRLIKEIGVRGTARRLGLPPETIANHGRYAGIIPVRSEIRAQEIQRWRERRNLYLDQPVQVSQAL